MTDRYVEHGGLMVPAGAARHGTIHLPDGSSIDVANPPPRGIPNRLAHLDHSAGRVVPWVMARTPGGGVDVDGVDPMRVMDCLEDETCGMCALPLAYWRAWLLAEPTRVTNYPAEHEDCARYRHDAWSAGPWLHIGRTYKWKPIKNRDATRYVIEVKLPPAKRLIDLTSAC